MKYMPTSISLPAGLHYLLENKKASKGGVLSKGETLRNILLGFKNAYHQSGSSIMSSFETIKKEGGPSGGCFSNLGLIPVLVKGLNNSDVAELSNVPGLSKPSIATVVVLKMCISDIDQAKKIFPFNEKHNVYRGKERYDNFFKDLYDLQPSSHGHDDFETYPGASEIPHEKDIHSTTIADLMQRPEVMRNLDVVEKKKENRQETLNIINGAFGGLIVANLNSKMLAEALEDYDNDHHVKYTKFTDIKIVLNVILGTASSENSIANSFGRMKNSYQKKDHYWYMDENRRTCYLNPYDPRTELAQYKLQTSAAHQSPYSAYPNDSIYAGPQASAPSPSSGTELVRYNPQVQAAPQSTYPAIRYSAAGGYPATYSGYSTYAAGPQVAGSPATSQRDPQGTYPITEYEEGYSVASPAVRSSADQQVGRGRGSVVNPFAARVQKCLVDLDYIKNRARVLERNNWSERRIMEDTSLVAANKRLMESLDGFPNLYEAVDTKLEGTRKIHWKKCKDMHDEKYSSRYPTQDHSSISHGVSDNMENFSMDWEGARETIRTNQTAAAVPHQSTQARSSLSYDVSGTVKDASMNREESVATPTVDQVFQALEIMSPIYRGNHKYGGSYRTTPEWKKSSAVLREFLGSNASNQKLIDCVSKGLTDFPTRTKIWNTFVGKSSSSQGKGEGRKDKNSSKNNSNREDTDRGR